MSRDSQTPRPSKGGYRPSATECVAVLTLINALEGITTEAQFKDCMDTDMQAIFPHRGLVCGLAKSIPDRGEVTERYLLLNHFSAEYLKSLRGPEGQIRSPLIGRWQETKLPVLVELEHDADGWPAEWVRNARQHGFHNFASHSFFESDQTWLTNFCFSDVPGRLTTRHSYLLRLLVPHLHLTLLRLAGVETAPAPAGMTPLHEHQFQILRWLYEGKTNWEIAMILGMSRHNVKYHVKQLFTKLRVANRVHAVARAIELGMFRNNG